MSDRDYTFGVRQTPCWRHPAFVAQALVDLAILEADRTLNNFHIEDEVIEKPHRACVAKLASHYVISVARGPERNRCRLLELRV